jgi:hypothetical protein
MKSKGKDNTLPDRIASFLQDKGIDFRSQERIGPGAYKQEEPEERERNFN